MQKLNTLNSNRTLSLREIYGLEVRIEGRHGSDASGGHATKAGGRRRGARDNTKIWVFGTVEDVLFHPAELRAAGLSIKPAASAFSILRRLALGRPAKRVFVRLGDLGLTDDGAALVLSRQVLRRGKKETALVEATSVETPGGIGTAEVGITWADTAILYGMPIVTVDGERLGKLSDARFAPGSSGKLTGIELSSGATADATLGKRVIPAEQILRFQLGTDAEEADTESHPEQAEFRWFHRIIVTRDAEECVHEGGLAERAGVTAAAVGSVAAEMGTKMGEASLKATRTVSKNVTKSLQGDGAVGKAGRHAKSLWNVFTDSYKEGLQENDSNTQ